MAYSENNGTEQLRVRLVDGKGKEYQVKIPSPQDKNIVRPPFNEMVESLKENLVQHPEFKSRNESNEKSANIQPFAQPENVQVKDLKEPLKSVSAALEKSIQPKEKSHEVSKWTQKVTDSRSHNNKDHTTHR